MRLLSRLTRLPYYLAARLSRRSSPFSLAKHPQLIAPTLYASIADTVWLPAMKQAVKGIVTAGLGKSFAYAIAKLGKRFL